MLRFFNTLTRQIEDFQPIEDGKVRMYICGPTVWNFAHIGNFRTFVFGDILRRYLKFKGYELTHVMNLTDIDDRIINEAAARNISIDEFTAPYTQYFLEDFDALGNERPEIMPRATHHIAEMIEIISKLLENGHAYESDGSIYYRIAAFPEYGKLSKIKFEGNIAGGSERIDTDKYDKEDARDFALWKLVGENEQPGWDAPFGRGRPGWHIECSAMAMKYLGPTFDLHAGGQDLQFPHHENEIAQSEGSTGKQFAKYWIHSEFLKIDDVTMSKSKGNFFTFRDLTKQGYSPLAIRYLLLSVPYRKQLNFTFEGLHGAESTVERLRNFRSLVKESGGSADERDAVELVILALRKFTAAMDDDLNTAAALAAVHDLVREVNVIMSERPLSPEERDAVLDAVGKFNMVLGIFGEEDDAMLDADIEALIKERQQARANRDFARSDHIRDELAAKGIILEDTKEGVRWKRK
ncbi:cysteine--tRNA ligase [Leptolyngbya sp. 7M]|uniref:cysteine--tRNA ligase n=1 Tax=Leptolyngbya sp. 7M TaxID=2812896 RepID=UPI001B8AA644|nr:cysteine--tRNA ligase [Leptolyngbya sp. 7M]QYO65994.1 cysteine--tRNA ligase [Leptolyngbya sp. 7M]